MIGESLVFREDDRLERPFVILQIKNKKIRNAWFVMFNVNTYEMYGI
jgi:hypothetical protein